MPVRVIANTAPGESAGPRSVVRLAETLASRFERAGVFPTGDAVHAAAAVRGDRTVSS